MRLKQGGGIPDPSGSLPGKPAAAINVTIDTMKDLNDARSRAITCGSMSGYQCFKATQENAELGKKLCGQK